MKEDSVDERIHDCEVNMDDRNTVLGIIMIL
jgi:hypothetical protein